MSSKQQCLRDIKYYEHRHRLKMKGRCKRTFRKIFCSTVNIFRKTALNDLDNRLTIKLEMKTSKLKEKQKCRWTWYLFLFWSKSVLGMIKLKFLTFQKEPYKNKRHYGSKSINRKSKTKFRLQVFLWTGIDNSSEIRFEIVS